MGNRVREMARRGPYQKNHRCVDCGAPTGRAGSRCPECGHQDRLAKKRAYMKRRGHLERTPPSPIAQSDGNLPPLGVLLMDDDGSRIQCHVCGEWLTTLVRHIKARHHIDAATYKETYGISRSAGLVSPLTAAKMRDAAVARRGWQPLLDAAFPPPVPTAHRGPATLMSRLKLSQTRRSNIRNAAREEHTDA